MDPNASFKNGRLTVTRLFDAPRPLVFDAWIKNSLVQLWWGCGFATGVQSDIDPKVGGKYCHDMTLKDVDSNYQHNGLITEYKPPELLAYQLTDSHHDNVMMVRIEFIEEGSQTLVRLTQDNLPEEYSEFVMAGWSSGFEKLAEVLDQLKNRKEQELIS